MDFLEDTLNYIDKNVIQFWLTFIMVLAFILTRSIVRKIVKRHAQKNKMAYSREVYVKKLVSLALTLVFITLVGMVWEISLQGLSVYFASIFTVIGVGLFATWSVLSNLTASVILFFFFPYRIGGHIKIIDGDNSIEGEVMDITLFYIKVKTENNEIYSCPNNVAIQKAIRLS